MNRQQKRHPEAHKKLSMTDEVQLAGCFLPSFRTAVAIQNKTIKNILIRVDGGIGDQICAEPTLRWAVRNLKDFDVSLVCPYPAMFSHLQFKKIFTMPQEVPPYGDYLLFTTYTPTTYLAAEFFGGDRTNCVDFASLSAFRMQLPLVDKQINLSSLRPDNWPMLENRVVVHPGKHWPSNTFPKDWWDEVLGRLKSRGIVPVIIGSDAQDKIQKDPIHGRGTVDVDASGCIDLRNKTSLLETIWVVQRSRVVLTNDSSPLHMAASQDPGHPHTTGWNRTGFIGTAKRGEYISHWRKGVFARGEKDFAKGGIWESAPKIVRQDQPFFTDKVDDTTLRSWLPLPNDFADWAFYQR